MCRKPMKCVRDGAHALTPFQSVWLLVLAMVELVHSTVSFPIVQYGIVTYHAILYRIVLHRDITYHTVTYRF